MYPYVPVRTGTYEYVRICLILSLAGVQDSRCPSHWHSDPQAGQLAWVVVHFNFLHFLACNLTRKKQTLELENTTGKARPPGRPLQPALARLSFPSSGNLCYYDIIDFYDIIVYFFDVIVYHRQYHVWYHGYDIAYDIIVNTMTS